jgi:hypothetical protein
MASGHVNRIKRPNTWLHRPMLQNVKKALANPQVRYEGMNRPSSVAVRGPFLNGHPAAWTCAENHLHSGPEHRGWECSDVSSSRL